jgi:streptogramin lyase
MPSDLHEILRSAAARPSEPLDLQNALRRGLRRRRTRRFGMAATFLALIIGSAMVARLPLAERDGSARPSQPTPSDADVNPHVSAKVEVGPTPEVIDVAAAALWVSVLDDEMSNEGFSLARINPETNDVEARVPVDIPVDHLGVGEGALWATGFDKELQEEVLVKIDPETGRRLGMIAGVRTPAMNGRLAIGEGSVWLLSDSARGRAILRVDPETVEVEAEIPLDDLVMDIEIGEGSIWALLAHVNGDVVGPADIVRINPDTNEIAARIPLDAHAPWIAVGAGSVWVPGWLHDFKDVSTGEDDRPVVVRIDASTNEVVGDPIPIHTTFRAFGVGEGGVWFIAGPEKPSGICRLNMQSLEVDHCVDPGLFADVAFEPAVLDISRGVVWVANSRATVTRLDLR